MTYLKAYINEDCIANYYDDNLPQVDIMELDDNGDIIAEEYESYETIEEMQTRVNYINNNQLTWKDL